MTEVLKILSDTSIRPTLAVWRSHARGWRDVGYGLLPFIGYNRKKVSASIAVKTTVFYSVMLGMIL